MISYADVERLLAVRVPAVRAPAAEAARHTRGQLDHDRDQRSVLSLYLRIPADPAELSTLPARARGLVALAAGSPDTGLAAAGGIDSSSENDGPAADWAAADEHAENASERPPSRWIPDLFEEMVTRTIDEAAGWRHLPIRPARSRPISGFLSLKSTGGSRHG
jgi:hypothetical protein